MTEKYREHQWKLRIRTAASAKESDKEIRLVVRWDHPIDSFPDKKTFDDPILGALFRFQVNWRYVITVREHGREVSSHTLLDRKEALAKYKELCREFPRSKDVDYGFPLM